MPGACDEARYGRDGKISRVRADLGALTRALRDLSR